MTEAAYAAVPEHLVVRELHVRITNPGYRTKSVVLVTTLRDATAFPKEEIAELYRWRWQAELDLRSLKQTLGMDQLRSSTPELMERELWMHVLAYNLVRKVMAQAALWAATQPRRRRRRPGAVPMAKAWRPREFSFTGAVEQVMTWWHENTTGAPETQRERYEALLQGVSRKHVGQRPGRIEPRAVKRRPKEYDRLMEPRAQARARLLGQKLAPDAAAGAESPARRSPPRKPKRSGTAARRRPREDGQANRQR
jgi:hypothetical protein